MLYHTIDSYELALYLLPMLMLAFIIFLVLEAVNRFLTLTQRLELASVPYGEHRRRPRL
jgi:hypothetical protein